ncbi:MAG: universal stress protein [Candidatus Tectomicrobia bacterium]|uniref:Universal stress protein n=1 Tax=Tectimicrobiota bacterium TaxID=2528274 RepID=A0A932HZK3_UNCTE|nr:universal stress protein [Candidatus Tectomicrobia bacterium]
MAASRIVLAVALQRYVDFPPVALRAREVAAALARAGRAVIDVVTVEAPASLLPDVESTEEKLNRFVRALRGMGLEVEGHLLAGKPSERIPSFVVHSGAEFLVIGSHSKRSPLDVGLGSTANALVGECPCPIVMVWPTREESARARELMIPGYPFVFPYG